VFYTDPSAAYSSAQSLLDAWRGELARQPLSMSEGEACGVLGITPQPNGVVPEEELKAAYRRFDCWVVRVLSGFAAIVVQLLHPDGRAKKIPPCKSFSADRTNVSLPL
jgi:hypothetical protein